MTAKRALTHVRAPDELGAEERAWQVVRSAYRQPSPAAPRRSHRRPAVALAGALLVGAIVLTPAGATVGRLITRALGVEHAAPALSALPAPGRVLVSGPTGTWTVGSDGSIRRLGPWAQASWSPHGRYLAVTAPNQLSALNPQGAVQWTLARRAVSDPRWYAPTGYRIAYLSGTELRVVAGDGTGDHLLAAGVAHVAPAWRPSHPYQLAYVTARGTLLVRDADTGATLWSTRPDLPVAKLTWATDGRELLALSPRELLLYGASGRPLYSTRAPRRRPFLDAALSPDGRTLAVVAAGGTEVTVRDVADARSRARTVLAGQDLGQLAWSPDGHWLLVAWPTANQWVFVRASGRPRISAVSRIAQQFSVRGDAVFPALDGWCCSLARAAAP
jgi:hypothetical protein